MYNRYIPQPDGSYRRNRVPDRNCPQPQKPRQECAPEKGQECKETNKDKHEEKKPVCPPPKPDHDRPKQDICHREPPCAQGGNIGSFFKNILPKDFDTGDLVVLLLLLLMAGDCEEDKNSALLTLVLYLFL